MTINNIEIVKDNSITLDKNLLIDHCDNDEDMQELEEKLDYIEFIEDKYFMFSNENELSLYDKMSSGQAGN